MYFERGGLLLSLYFFFFHFHQYYIYDYYGCCFGSVPVFITIAYTNIIIIINNITISAMIISILIIAKIMIKLCSTCTI